MGIIEKMGNLNDFEKKINECTKKIEAGKNLNLGELNFLQGLHNLRIVQLEEEVRQLKQSKVTK